MKYDSLARWRLVLKKPIITELIDFPMMMFIEMKKWFEESWFEMTSWEYYCYFKYTHISFVQNILNGILYGFFSLRKSFRNLQENLNLVHQ